MFICTGWNYARVHQQFITDRSKAVLLLWFNLFVNVCPLSARYLLIVRLIKDSLAVIFWERAVLLGFRSFPAEDRKTVCILCLFIYFSLIYLPELGQDLFDPPVKLRRHP